MYDRGEMNDSGGDRTSDLTNRRTLVQFLIGLGTSLLILYYIFFKFIDVETFIEKLSSISVPLLIASDIPYLIQSLLYGYRLQIGLREAGVRVPYRQAYWSHLFGMFWSNFALGKLGYFAAAFPLRKNANIFDSTGVISAIQSLDLAVKGTAAIIGLMFLSQIMEIQEVRFWAMIMSVVFVIVGIAVLSVLWFGKSIIKVENMPLLGKYLIGFMDSGFLVRGAAYKILGLAIVGWLLRGIEWLLLFYACGIKLPFLTAFLLHPLLTIIRMIPFTFSGVGVLEFTLIKLFPSYPPENLVMFGLMDMMNNMIIEVISLKEIIEL